MEVLLLHYFSMYNNLQSPYSKTFNKSVLACPININFQNYLRLCAAGLFIALLDFILKYNLFLTSVE